MRRASRADREIRRRVGAAIKARCAALGLTTLALARASRVDDRQMARVFEGKSGLGPASLGRVAAALGCAPEDLTRDAYAARSAA